MVDWSGMLGTCAAEAGLALLAPNKLPVWKFIFSKSAGRPFGLNAKPAAIAANLANWLELCTNRVWKSAAFIRM